MAGTFRPETGQFPAPAPSARRGTRPALLPASGRRRSAPPANGAPPPSRHGRQSRSSSRGGSRCRGHSRGHRGQRWPRLLGRLARSRKRRGALSAPDGARRYDLPHSSPRLWATDGGTCRGATASAAAGRVNRTTGPGAGSSPGRRGVLADRCAADAISAPHRSQMPESPPMGTRQMSRPDWHVPRPGVPPAGGMHCSPLSDVQTNPEGVRSHVRVPQHWPLPDSHGARPDRHVSHLFAVSARGPVVEPPTLQMPVQQCASVVQTWSNPVQVVC
jgi:hypothetical protein